MKTPSNTDHLLKPSGLALAIAGCLLSSVLQAQETDVEELDAIEVSADASNSGTTPIDGYAADTTVTGTKTATAITETPQSITTVTADEIKDQNAANLGEVLRYTAGARGETFGFEPRTTFLRIRGFDVATSGIFRDGLKLSNPNFAAGYSLEPYGAERIDVLKGPSSILYGQAGPGGLVNYVSKRPTFDTRREVRVEAGTNELVQGQFDISGAVNDSDTLALRLVGLVRDSETQVDFVDDDRKYLAPSLTWQPTDATRFTVLAHWQYDDTQPSQRYPLQGTLEPNPNGKIPDNRFTGEPGFDNYERRENALGYEFEHIINDQVTVRQNVRNYRNDVDDQTIYTTSLLPDQRTITRARFDSFGRIDGLNVDNQVEIGFNTGAADHTVLVGLDHQDIDVSSRQFFGAASNLDIFEPQYGAAVADAPIFKDDEGELKQTGVYLQDQIRWDRWTLSLGGRYDNARSETLSNLSGTTASRDDEEFSGRAGVTYRFDNGLSPYISYMESFLPTTGTDANGQPFAPETAHQYEVGVKYQPTSRTLVTLAYFDLTREDYLTTNPTSFLSEQKGEARSRGVELEARGQLAMGLELIASYAYTDAEITEASNPVEEGEPLEYTPEHEASLWSKYAFSGGPLHGLSLGAGVRYTGDSNGALFNGPNSQLEVPSVTLVDASITYDIGEVALGLHAQNLLDKDYVGTAFDSSATYGLRREVTGSVTYRF
ncbi:TonB-dependent siderophore receptor [uncultured Marinobacter sp.]|uniref:TonB-dependent siderophore receptor n=1 Tax=uncultured Marinobacter sp. TaxID=187379 RepID=UPI002606824F|nr:TonB-dependent siderophore receptor [uncultured Marinobacter sp.]